MSDVKVTEGSTGTDVSVKLTGGGKGALASITPQPGVLMDQKTNSGILANMEKLAAEIENPWRKLNEGFKDVAAWTQYNKGPAFALREEAANTDRSTLYNIRQQQAAVIAAQQQAQAEANNIARFRQGIAGGAGGSGGMSGATPAQQQLLAAMDTLQPNQVGAQRALIDEYNKAQISGSSKAQYDASANSPVNYTLPNGESVSITPNTWNNMPAAQKRAIEMSTYKAIGFLPNPPGSANAGAPPQSNVGAPSLGNAAMTGERGNAAQIAASLNIPIISGDRDWDKQYDLYLNSKKPGYSGPPVAFPGTSKHQTGYAIDAGPINAEQRQKLIDNGFKQTVRNDPNHWELVAKPAETAVISGGAAPTAPVVSGGAAPTAPVVSGGRAPIMPQVPVEKTLTQGESIVAPSVATKPVVAPTAPVVAPSAPAAAPSAPVAQGPSIVQSATAQEPMPKGSDYGLNRQAYEAAMEAWKTRQTQRAQGLGTASTEIAKKDAEKKNEYLNSIGTTQKTYDEFDRLLQSSKGKNGVFNLAGGLVGTAQGKITPKFESDPTEHHAIARSWLSNEDQTHFKNIDQGASVAQAAWAKNLVEGAGGRLTNADLALGKPAKGVGIETTYESHMQNLAKNMQDIRTAYYRGKEFENWSRQNPNGSAAEFELTPYYAVGSKLDAARDVAKKFSDIPESNFVHQDKASKRPYVIINGKSIYL